MKCHSMNSTEVVGRWKVGEKGESKGISLASRMIYCEPWLIWRADEKDRCCTV